MCWQNDIISECIQTVHLVITVDYAKARSICKCSSELLLCPDPTTTQLNWLRSAGAQPVLRVHWLQLNVHHVISSCLPWFKILQLINLIQRVSISSCYLPQVQQVSCRDFPWDSPTYSTFRFTLSNSWFCLSAWTYTHTRLRVHYLSHT